MFLNVHHPLTEECHAIYLLVEIRKLFDRENIGTASLLRFYADWSVHTEKDKITPQIRATMAGILHDIRAGVATNNLDAGTILRPFVFMDNLRGEFRNFLMQYRLPLNLVAGGWLAFRNLLAAVLADQPINKPCAGIHRFSFTYAPNGHLIGEVVYERKPGQSDTLAFG